MKTLKMNSISRLAIIGAAAVGALSVTGCASMPGAAGGDPFSKAPVYSPNDAFRGAESRVVTIRSINTVMLKKNPEGNWQAYAIPGAAAAVGGILGNQAGKPYSATSNIGAIVGAAGGALLGNMFAQPKSEVPAVEFNVSYVAQENGKPKNVTVSVVQEADASIREIAPGWKPGSKLAPVQARMVRTAVGERIVPL